MSCLIKASTYVISRLRQSTSQIEMDTRILQALDRTQRETAHLVLVPSPWLPATPSSKYRYNKTDVFVHSSYPSDRTENRISPQKKTGVGCEPSTVRVFPTPPPLRNDKQSLEERAELVARLTLYRAIRRAPWSPSRRKRIDSDPDFYFTEDGSRTLGDGPECGGAERGGGIEDISMIRSGRNHLTGEYRNEEDDKAFRRINTSIDEQYCDTPIAGHKRDSYAPFDIQYEESLPQDLYRRERSHLSGEKEKKIEKENENAKGGFYSRSNTVENTVEALRIEVPDPWDPLKFNTDRSEESAQRPSGFNSTHQLSGFNSAQRPSDNNSDLQQWDRTKNIAFDLGYDSLNSNSNSNSNIPSEKSNAESALSCQESSPRSAVLSGQQAYYVLRVRVVRKAHSVDSRGREIHLNQSERGTGQGHRGVRGGDRDGDRGGVELCHSTEVNAAVAVDEQRGVLLVKRGVTKGSLLTALSAQFPSALSVREGESSFSMTVSHTPIRSRIRDSDAFDDIRGPNSASSTNSTSLPPGPFTPLPVVVSLTEETLDFSPVLDETSELVLSYY
jgi:hypothetical protein